MNIKYEVTKEISKKESWETGAKVGEVLTVETWNGFATLMKGNKAVCDIDSEIEKEHCKKLD